jgi:predicted MarR family transcription regulator
VVSYSLKKLEKLKLVKAGRLGKEKTVQVTPAGEALCLRYREVREALLVKSVVGAGVDAEKLSLIAAQLRALSGQYDQAARAAASM